MRVQSVSPPTRPCVSQIPASFSRWFRAEISRWVAPYWRRTAPGFTPGFSQKYQGGRNCSPPVFLQRRRSCPPLDMPIRAVFPAQVDRSAGRFSAPDAPSAQCRAYRKRSFVDAASSKGIYTNPIVSDDGFRTKYCGRYRLYPLPCAPGDGPPATTAHILNCANKKSWIFVISFRSPDPSRGREGANSLPAGPSAMS